MAFKMRGSPMQRNYGISPLQDKDPHTVTDPPHNHDMSKTVKPVTGKTGGTVSKTVKPVTGKTGKGPIDPDGKTPADTHASSEPSVEEQLKLRNSNKQLKDQCANNNGTWDFKIGKCTYPNKK